MVLRCILCVGALFGAVSGCGFAPIDGADDLATSSSSENDLSTSSSTDMAQLNVSQDLAGLAIGSGHGLPSLGEYKEVQNGSTPTFGAGECGATMTIVDITHVRARIACGDGTFRGSLFSGSFIQDPIALGGVVQFVGRFPTGVGNDELDRLDFGLVGGGYVEITIYGGNFFLLQPDVIDAKGGGSAKIKWLATDGAEQSSLTIPTLKRNGP